MKTLLLVLLFPCSMLAEVPVLQMMGYDTSAHAPSTVSQDVMKQAQTPQHLITPQDEARNQQRQQAEDTRFSTYLGLDAAQKDR